jgi:hypothetical protein
MNKKLLTLLIFAILLTSNSYSQDKTWGFALSGFVKTDIFYDSRQVLNAREGHFLYFPLGESLDKNGSDLNAKGSFNIISVQTRLNGKLTGPDAFGAKSSAMVEGEFFGTSDADVNGFRLRHATVNLDWKTTSLMVGQYWHPMFVTDVFPGTISFNTGAPFQPFTRNPQIRLTQGLDSKNSLKLMLTAYSERDFQSLGPAGASSFYLRSALLPGLDLQLQYKSERVVFGVSGDFKMLKPRLVTTKNVTTDETVNSFAGEGYFKFKSNDFTLKLEGTYVQNGTDMSMLGGYALTTLDTTTGAETYSPVSVFSVWGDISYGKDIEVGIFGGYTKNLGASDNLYSNSSAFYYSRGYNIDGVFRVSPRIAFSSGKSKIAAEIETTGAAYGTVNKDNKGKVENTKSLINVRGLLAFYYFF